MTGSPFAPSSRRDVAILAGVVMLFVLIFLHEPILGFRDHSFTSADILADYELLSPDPKPMHLSNRLLGDTVIQMQPWMRFNMESLRAGEVPLWNPYNGAGVPHLANFQSAVFSPFNLPFYLFGFKAGLVLSASAKLIVAGFFTAMFLRELGLSLVAAAFGAISFAFSGQLIVLLAYPHSGVSATLPASLYFAERTLGALERKAGRAKFATNLALLTLSLAAGLYAGHPEPFVFVALVTGAWIVVRSVGVWRTLGGDAQAASGVATGFGAMCAAGSIAALLAAPLWIPFAEYLSQTTTLSHRAALTVPGLDRDWPLQMFPNTVGMPREGREIDLELPSPNYPQINSAYAGGVVLLFAAVGLWSAWHTRRARFFAIGAILWACVSCNLLGLGSAYANSRVLSEFAPFYRSQAIWLFSTAALAAFGLDAFVRRGDRARWFLAVAMVSVGTIALVSTLAAAQAMRAAHLETVEIERRALVVANLSADELFGAACFVAALIAAGALLVVRGRSARCALAVAAMVAAFGESGWLLRDYNPTVADDLVYPNTEAVERLRREVGDGRMLLLSDNGIPPDSNVAHHLATLQNYDVLGVRRYDELFSSTCRVLGNWRDEVTHIGRRTLKLFGVEWVLCAGDWVPVFSGNSDRVFSREANYSPLGLKPDVDVRQSFVCDRAGLCAASVLLGCEAGSASNSSTTRVRLLDAETGVSIAEHEFDAEWLRRENFTASDHSLKRHPFPQDRGWQFRQAVLDFDPRADSEGRRYVIACTSSGPSGDGAALLWTSDSQVGARERLTVGDEAMTSSLYFDWRCDRSFSKRARIAHSSLFHYDDGIGLYFSVSRAIEVNSRNQALLGLAAPEFDPYRVVLLEPDPDAQNVEPLSRPTFPSDLDRSPNAAPATVIERTARRVRLRVERSEPGWLIACQSFYPGWKAIVDGHETPIVCANYAFLAVPVPAGTSEVELDYEPNSFRNGVLAAIAALLIGGGWLARSLLNNASAPR